LVPVRYLGLDAADDATGTVVVIDVLRAFTTAAFAFAAGAQRITVVSTVTEALGLREENPDWLIMGEEDGLPVDGFDFDNSPSALIGRDLTGCRLIQRTSAGTQGVVRSRRATHLFAASLTCAQATVRAILTLGSDQVTMVITGSDADGWGDEDLACADYLKALIHGEVPDDERAIERVLRSKAAEKFRDPQRPQFAPTDLDCAVDVDRFAFALPLQWQGAYPVMKPAFAEDSQRKAGSDGAP